MNKKELIKMFDNSIDSISGEFGQEDLIDREQVKNFIFDTLIFEVLKSIIPENIYFEGTEIYPGYKKSYNDILKELRQEAKKNSTE